STGADGGRRTTPGPRPSGTPWPAAPRRRCRCAGARKPGPAPAARGRDSGRSVAPSCHLPGRDPESAQVVVRESLRAGAQCRAQPRLVDEVLHDLVLLAVVEPARLVTVARRVDTAAARPARRVVALVERQDDGAGPQVRVERIEEFVHAREAGAPRVVAEHLLGHGRVAV